MKAAICVSGQPRCFKKGFDQIKQFIIDNNLSIEFDFFMHAWHSEGSFDASAWAYSQIERPPENYIDDLKKIYKPKSILVEDQIEFTLPRVYERAGTKQHIPYSMFYSVKQAFNLKTEYEKNYKFKYDWVFRIRYDFNLETYIDINNLNSDIVYVPDNIQVRTSKKISVNDMFAFSNSDNMNVYGDTFNNIDSLYLKHKNMDYIQEDIIGHQLYYNGIKIAPCAFNCGIHRLNNTHYIRAKLAHNNFNPETDIYEILQSI